MSGSQGWAPSTFLVFYELEVVITKLRGNEDENHPIRTSPRRYEGEVSKDQAHNLASKASQVTGRGFVTLGRRAGSDFLSGVTDESGRRWLGDAQLLKVSRMNRWLRGSEGVMPLQ